MIQQEKLSEAMRAFLSELPDPNSSSMSTIESEIDIKGEHVKFVAQKVKGGKGITWRVYPAEKWEN